MKYKFIYKEHGGHTHARLFAGNGKALSLCGELYFLNDEWKEFKKDIEKTLGAEFEEQRWT
jgi:hypothetical protein